MDLILFPCCDSKKGNRPVQNPISLSNLISQQANNLLQNGRNNAFNHPRVTINLNSPLVQALYLYTGNLYEIQGFRNSIIQALDNGIHCLIISGSYGLLHPFEPINWYNANMSTARSIWRPILPRIILDYINNNNISRIFVSCAEGYLKALNMQQWAAGNNVYCYIPRLRASQGARVRVPQMTGRAIFNLIANMIPQPPWQQYPNC